MICALPAISMLNYQGRHDWQWFLCNAGKAKNPIAVRYDPVSSKSKEFRCRNFGDGAEELLAWRSVPGSAQSWLASRKNGSLVLRRVHIGKNEVVADATFQEKQLGSNGITPNLGIVPFMLSQAYGKPGSDTPFSTDSNFLVFSDNRHFVTISSHALAGSSFGNLQSWNMVKNHPIELDNKEFQEETPVQVAMVSRTLGILKSDGTFSLYGIKADWRMNFLRNSQSKANWKLVVSDSEQSRFLLIAESEVTAFPVDQSKVSKASSIGFTTLGLEGTFACIKGSRLIILTKSGELGNYLISNSGTVTLKTRRNLTYANHIALSD